MPVRVQTADFDAGREIAALRGSDPRVGAVASFIGTVRDVNDAANVATMTLEHYPGMTEKALARDRRRGARALRHPRRARHPSRRRVAAGRPDRARRRDQRASRRRVRRVPVHHGLPQDARAVLEEGGHRRRARAGSTRASATTTPRRAGAKQSLAAHDGHRAHRHRLGHDVGARVSRRRDRRRARRRAARRSASRRAGRPLRRCAARRCSATGATTARRGIACGMIGSRQGWIEAPYVACPAPLADLVAGIVRTPEGALADRAGRAARATPTACPTSCAARRRRSSAPSTSARSACWRRCPARTANGRASSRDASSIS